MRTTKPIKVIKVVKTMESNKFVIYKTSKDGKYYWILYASNGYPIAKSFNKYASLAACYNGIDSVRKHYDSIIQEDL